MSSPFDSPEHVSARCAYVDLAVRSYFNVANTPPDRACLKQPEGVHNDPSLICGAIVRLVGVDIAPGVRIPVVDDEETEPCRALLYLEQEYRRTGGESQHPSTFLDDAINHAEQFGYPPHVPPPDQR